MTIEPAFADFEAKYSQGAPQVVWTRLIDDLETPVSAYLKIAHGRPYAFLFESVEGGAHRGRYSVIAMKPDLVWRCRGDLKVLVVTDRIVARCAVEGGECDGVAYPVHVLNPAVVM